MSQRGWFTGPNRSQADRASVRLVCFAHAGGGAALYRQWAQALPAQVDVRSVVLPGRENRLGEPPARCIEDLLDPLTEAVMPLLDLPVAFFGHSMGTAIAFELARRLSRERTPPRLLMVSGRRAPHLPSRRPQSYDLDDTAFIGALQALNGTPEEVLADRALMGLLMPTLRADFELIETYRPLPGPLLDLPVVAYRGMCDPEVNRPELRAWQQMTSGPFSTMELDGDHFYLQPPPPGLLADVTRRLLDHALT